MKPGKAAITALLDGVHADPFALLGAHEGPKGTFARAILSGAEQAEAHALDGTPLGTLALADPGGLFEGLITGPRQPKALTVLQAPSARNGIDDGGWADTRPSEP